jgi:hypothetical protein
MAKKARPAAPASVATFRKQRLVLKCGYVVQRSDPDYGYDLRLETFDEQDNLEAGQVPLQLKATDTIDAYELATEESFSFPLSTKDYRLWSEEVMPVFLILYDARFEEAYWLHIQDYHQTQKPTVAGDTIRVHIPRKQVLGVRTIRLMRQRKQEILRIIKETLRRTPKPKEG